jgi:DNA ligase 1
MGDKPFEDRIAYLKKTFGKGGSHASMHRIKVVEQELVRDRQHVLDRLKEVEEEGGEGLMLREPGSTYQGNRSNTLLKVKVSIVCD